MLPNEGETLLANLLFKNGSVDRGTSMQLGLFTNATGVDETITYAAITEPTGGSYSRKTITDASWTVTGDTSTYALQRFTATGSAYGQVVYGYFLCTNGGTANRLIDVVVDPGGPRVMLQNDTYDVTLTEIIA